MIVKNFKIFFAFFLLFTVNNFVFSQRENVDNSKNSNGFNNNSDRKLFNNLSVAAYVSGKPILMSEVVEISNGLNIKKISALNIIIEQKLLEEEFIKQKGKIPEMNIDAQIDIIAKDKFNGDFNVMNRVLKAQGQTFYGLKESIRKSSMINALKQQFIHNVDSVSPANILKYYRSHITDFNVEAKYLLKQSGFNDDGIINICGDELLRSEYIKYLKPGFWYIEDVRRRLETFSTERCWYDENELDDKSLEIIKKLEFGESSEYIQVDNVFVSYTLYKASKCKQKSFDEVKQKIEKMLLEKSNANAYKNYVDSLRRNSSIQILLKDQD